MKRIDYTAVAIRLLGIVFAAWALWQAIDLSAFAPPASLGTPLRLSFRFLGYEFDPPTGMAVLFGLKLTTGVLSAVFAPWLAKLFWRGIPLPIPREPEADELN